MSAEQSYKEDYGKALEAFENIKAYPIHALALFQELPPRQRFVTGVLLEKYIKALADARADEEDTLSALDDESYNAALNTLMAEDVIAAAKTQPEDIKNAVENVVYWQTENLQYFEDNIWRYTLAAERHYAKHKPDETSIDFRAKELSKLFAKINMLPSFDMPADTIYDNLEAMPVLERFTRVKNLHSKLTNHPAYMKGLTQIQYRQNPQHYAKELQAWQDKRARNAEEYARLQEQYRIEKQKTPQNKRHSMAKRFFKALIRKVRTLGVYDQEKIDAIIEKEMQKIARNVQEELLKQQEIAKIWTVPTPTAAPKEALINKSKEIEL